MYLLFIFWIPCNSSDFADKLLHESFLHPFYKRSLIDSVQRCFIGLRISSQTGIFCGFSLISPGGKYEEIGEGRAALRFAR
jgi:hypothetical protein